MKIRKNQKRDKELETEFQREERTLLSIFNNTSNGAQTLMSTILVTLKDWISKTTEEQKKNKDDIEKEEDETKKEEINK